MDPSITTFPEGNQNCFMAHWICPANEDGLPWKPPVDNLQRLLSSAFSPSGEVYWTTPA